MSIQKIPQLKRRSFLTACGMIPVTYVPQVSAMLKGKDPFDAYKTFHATCSMECLHCNLKGYVDDNGKLVKIESDNSFNGKACARGLSRIKWIYAENRIQQPLKRVGERGEGKFEPISWDQALDEIAAKMKDAIAKDGSKSILLTSASGNMDSLHNGSQVAFGNYLGGVTRTVGSLCCSAVTAAMNPIVGLRYVDTRDSIKDAKCIIAWGNNPLVTMQAYWPNYLEAKKNGAVLVVIDPRKSETAVRADQWVSIIPGTDAALALGMIRVIAQENLMDTDFLKKSTGAVYLVDDKNQLMKESKDDANSYLVWDEKSNSVVRHDKPEISPALEVKGQPFKTALSLALEEAEKWTPEAVEEETGVPAEQVAKLARLYAKGPSMIVNNMGSFQRTEYGTQAVGGQLYLALITGNIGKRGAGVCDAGGVTQMGKFGSPVPAPKNKPAKVPPIPTAKLGEYVLNDKPCKINVWYTQTCGIVGQWPNANKVIAAVKKVPFFVVAESIMTPTARYADIILPATTVFEYESVMAGARNHYVQLCEKAIEPVGQAKPDYWIMAQLAKRMGFGEAFDLTPEQMIRNVLKPSGITYEELKEHPVSPVKGDWIPFEGGKFRTPNGKANFYCEPWVKAGFKPVVTYIPVSESPKGSQDLAKKYPLMAIQRKVIRNIHTSHQDNPWLNELFAKEPTVLINSEDGKTRGIKPDEVVVVFNDRGEHKAKAFLTNDIRRGVVCLENGWWMDTNGFNSSSVLTNDKVEVLGTGTSICSTLVEVRKTAL